ncbi:MAG: alpha/beta hydrolase [Steroidobacteraceae bacterium]
MISLIEPTVRRRRFVLSAAAATVLALLLAVRPPIAAGAEVHSPTVSVADDGTVHVPAHDVPLSEFLSPQAKAYVAQHLKDMQHPERLVQVEGVPQFLQTYLARQRVLYPVERRDTTIAGVHAYIFTPKAGVSARNRHRVLIDLHGGGFSGCWPACAELESMPIAALGKIEVVSLDYREGPKYRFPAASEDVATVYKELLKTHRPQSIGIYGCSAGGMLTAMAVAWFDRHGLPRPGAVGILCAGAATTGGAGFGGDATYTALPLGEARMPPSPGARPKSSPLSLAYLAGTDPHDPLVAPANSPQILAWFPPTLIVTATRDFAMSNAVYTHTQLVKAGVDAQLHVWEGLFHGFFYDPDVPESRDCYDVIVQFFDRELGNRSTVTHPSE